MSTTEESLSDILKNPAAPADPVTDVKTAPKGEAAPSAATEDKTPARDDSGKFAKTDTKTEPKADEKVVDKAPDKAAEKTPDKPAKEPRADVAAIIDERRKRQAAEQRVRELETKTPEKKASVFEDEDRAINQRVEEASRPLRESLYKQSVKIARLTYKDAYGEAEQAFIEAAEKDERLITALRNADDPGEYIYSTGIQIRELSDVGGDFLKYREKITSGLTYELTKRDGRINALEAELATMKKTQSDLDALPKSLNNRATGVTPTPQAGEGDDESIKSIVRFGKQPTR